MSCWLYVMDVSVYKRDIDPKTIFRCPVYWGKSSDCTDVNYGIPPIFMGKTPGCSPDQRFALLFITVINAWTHTPFWCQIPTWSGSNINSSYFFFEICQPMTSKLCLHFNIFFLCFHTKTSFLIGRFFFHTTIINFSLFLAFWLA